MAGEGASAGDAVAVVAAVLVLAGVLGAISWWVATVVFGERVDVRGVVRGWTVRLAAAAVMLVVGLPLGLPPEAVAAAAGVAALVVVPIAFVITDEVRAWRRGRGGRVGERRRWAREDRIRATVARGQPLSGEEERWLAGHAPELAPELLAAEERAGAEEPTSWEIWSAREAERRRRAQDGGK